MPTEKCCKCGKSVYVVERLAILDKVWHKGCFKCTTCGMTLNMKSYAATGGNPYCKPHYPMPTASGVSAEAPPVDPSSYNQGTDQTTQESVGQSSNEVYEPQYGNQGGYEQQEQEGGYEEQQYYEEQQ
eukprot:TRINITY_DN13851_c0_g1_i1.p3 TRINITY_DN13851_c0_g1~~TRINITY_DN13851_c0_g1_i1.p3  ORF type:complete len:128 (+),score=28.61 TRINITY_DN13851_c0_g1_i1:307-690(+)